MVKLLFLFLLLLIIYYYDRYYTYAVSLVIVIAAGDQLLSVEEKIDETTSSVIGILCQIVFTLDLIFKFLSHSPKYKLFLDNSWNVFDSVLVFLLWIPILAVGAPTLFYFELLKVLRIIRLLKIFSWIVEINIIMKSISTSARCLSYVVFLMTVFFYHFGVAGVYLFSRNDPFHFGNIGKALLTLFQVSTLDDWSGIARMNMYGCLYVGFDPVLCNEHDSYGWGWVAAWYFIVFVIVGVMVLVALFVGVIITSMELLQLSILEEDEMLKKVAAKQSEFGINDARAHTLLEIFDMIDVCANGRLTLHELKPILGMVSLQDAQQYELFHKIDEDMSGKIDFAEFVELIHLLNIAFMQKTHNIEILHKSGSSLKRFMGNSAGTSRNLLSLLTSGFKTKKSIKSVAKMSILAARLSKSAKLDASGREVAGSNKSIKSMMSKISEADSAAPSPNSKSGRSVNSSPSCLDGTASIALTPSPSSPAVDPMNSQNAPRPRPGQGQGQGQEGKQEGKWFGSSAVVPDDGTGTPHAQAAESWSAPFKSQSHSPRSSPSLKYASPLDMTLPFEGVASNNPDEADGVHPLGDKSNSMALHKGTTFSGLVDISPESSVNTATHQRPSTGNPRVNTSSLDHVVSDVPKSMHGKMFRTTDATPSPIASPSGSPKSGKKLKKRLNPKPSMLAADAGSQEKEPNLFFNYGDIVSGQAANGRYSNAGSTGSADRHDSVHL
jgi:voltage-gated sodium channel